PLGHNSRRLASAISRMRPEGRFFMAKSGAVMKRHQPIPFVAAVLALLAATAHAAPPEGDREVAQAAQPATAAPAKWVGVEARTHANGTRGLMAMVFGVAEERGQSRLASLRVDCLEGRTIVRVDTDELAAGPAIVGVRQSLDG